MRIAAMHKAIVSLMYKITISAVRIEPTKAVTSLLMNIKPIRSCKTSKNFMVYLAAW